MKRKTTDEERKLFKTHIDEARPLKAVTPKPAKLPKPSTDTPASRRPEGVPKSLDGHTSEKLKRGQLAPAARIDLHGMTEAAAHGALLSFLTSAQSRGVRLVLVITGIGNPKDQDSAEWMRARHGALKMMVPRWLNEREFAALVSGSGSAHRRHGGDGALYVYLRKQP
jgi:DNA-nicking Smr family endonuclease